MSFECTLEITANSSQNFSSSKFHVNLPKQYAYKENQKNGNISVSSNDFSFSSWPEFEKNTYDFLENLNFMSSEKELDALALRIAIYYDIEETVIFPFCFSNSLIKKAYEMKLSLEINGYPCSRES
ncbi:hypothetical protein N0497_29270 [Pseudomonas aeruginosa]|nr:hypothetical protein [Pseudomonas aeruginosa]